MNLRIRKLSLPSEELERRRRKSKMPTRRNKKKEVVMSRSLMNKGNRMVNNRQLRVMIRLKKKRRQMSLQVIFLLICWVNKITKLSRKIKPLEMIRLLPIKDFGLLLQWLLAYRLKF